MDKSSLYQCFSPFSQDADDCNYLSNCAGLVEFGKTPSDMNKLRITDKILEKSCHSIKKFLEEESGEDLRFP